MKTRLSAFVLFAVAALLNLSFTIPKEPGEYFFMPSLSSLGWLAELAESIGSDQSTYRIGA
ncbi:MAG TPA: hypothetical protein VHR97_11140 [Candidatus Baltobacteraceae bacterium]|jgi:hypothetical protein|nr:hypothetical protein [Candidatus Baltobacteraceae bacterium]